MDALFLILSAIFIGIVATAFMDVIAFGQRRLLGIPSLDYAMVGRWLGHIPRGQFVHRRIAQSGPIYGEAVIGWLAHYLIGIAFAAALLRIAGEGWLNRPGPLWPVAFGAATVAAPFLVLQPGMGAGFFARNVPQPWRARLRSARAHVVFGIGLWIGALCWTTLT